MNFLWVAINRPSFRNLPAIIKHLLPSRKLNSLTHFYNPVTRPSWAAPDLRPQNVGIFFKKVLTGIKSCVILKFTCERGFFVVRFFAFQAAADRSRQGGRRPSPRKVNIRRCRNNASQSDPEMQRVQAEKLQYHEKQEKYPGQAGAQQVLPFLPEAHAPHRNQII